MTRRLAIALAFTCWGCDDGDGGEPADAGAVTADAAGALDSGVGGDAGGTDAGPTDMAPVADASPIEDAAPIADAAPGPDAGPALECARGAVRFTTEDGVELVADLHPRFTTPRAAVLLHMIPPSNNRSNYPPAFIQALNQRGFTVLNVDRRGAGDSSGNAREAYEGSNGRLDAVAARDFLRRADCGVDPAKIIFVGASNGTTTALDYAIGADDADLPAGLVFLTGGAYTENQNRISAHRPRLDGLPILFVFSTQERGWSAGFMNDAAPAWAFDEYARGAHGTGMFNAVPASVDAVADWIDASVP